MSMRAQLPAVALLISCLFASFGRCQTREEDDSARLHREGSALVKAGRNLPRAIRKLESAVRAEPGKSEYQSALACAYASRFASVAVAAKLAERYDTDASFFRKMKAEWTEDQKDPAGKLYGAPEPASPNAPTTLDDGQPFTLSSVEARKELLRLGHRAVAAFDEARRSGVRLESSGQVKLEYARGWGLLLLRHFGEDFVLDVQPAANLSAPPKDFGPLVIPPADVVESLRRCAETKAATRELAGYHYSLAIARAPKLLGWAAVLGDAPEKSYSDDELRAAAAEFEKALVLQPSSRSALYALGLLNLGARPETAAEYLEKAARRSPDNAVAWYQASEARFRQSEAATEADRGGIIALAVALIERGNRAPKYLAIRVDTPAPPLLRKAWDLAEAYGIPDAYLAVNLGARVMEEARNAVGRGDLPAGLAAYRIEFDFGIRVSAAMAGEDLDSRLPRTQFIPRTRRQYGALHALVGYKEIETLNRNRPDPGVNAFLASNATTFERAKALERISY